MARSYKRDARGRFARTGSSRNGSGKRRGLSQKNIRRLRTASRVATYAAVGAGIAYASKPGSFRSSGSSRKPRESFSTLNKSFASASGSLTTPKMRRNIAKTGSSGGASRVFVGSASGAPTVVKKRRVTL